MTVEETYKELKQIKGKQYSVAVYNLRRSSSWFRVGFLLSFREGSERDSGLCGSRMYPGIFDYTGQKNPDEQLYFECNLCQFGVAVTAACVNRVTSGWNLDIVIISSLMPLVPGVAITNAIRDTLRGDYISGGARILEAFLTAAAIGLGAGTGMIFVGGIV